MKKRSFVFSVLLLLSLLLASCASTGKESSESEEASVDDVVEGIDSYYRGNSPEVIAKTFPDDCLLPSGTDPEVYLSGSLGNDVARLISQYKAVLGYAEIVGPEVDPEILAGAAKEYAEKLRAKNALFSMEVDGMNSLISGDFVYDYTFVFLSDMSEDMKTKNAKAGFQVRDMTDSDRRLYGRNYGAVVDIVFEGSKAFYNNVVQGDLVIDVNGFTVYGREDFNKYLSLVDEGENLVLKVIRGSSEREITYPL